MQPTPGTRPALFLSLFLTVACGASAPKYNLPCSTYDVPPVELKHKTQDARVDVEWHEEWTSRFGETLPEPLTPFEHWQHPILSGRYAGTMHEDSQATDVSAFSIKGYFNKREFGDNVARITMRGSLGVKHYDREVFNNLWGTFTFGPNDTLYIGAYRGFLRFQSGTAPGEKD